MSAEDGGLLGNLPRSRPGTRSQKRPAEAAGEAARSAERRQAASARPPRQGARPQKTRGRKRPEPAPDSDAGRGPVEDALRLAGQVAETGARTAFGVTRGVLRRLPRP